MRSASVRVWIALALAAGAIALIATGGATNAPAKSASRAESAPAKAPRGKDGRVAAQSKRAARNEAKASRAADKPRGEQGAVLARAAWGSGPADLGHTRPSEGAPEGPMSFAVGADGSLVMLDQVNSRLVVRSKDGAPRILSLPADTYQDVETDGRGGFIVLDRLATQTVTFLDAEGKVRHSISLVGPGIDAGGMVSGLFARADGVWIEVEHRVSVRIADASGVPDPARPAVDGRFSSDGRWLLSALLDGRKAAKVLVRPAKGAGTILEARVPFTEPVLGLLELDTDQAGRVILVAHTLVEDPADPAHIVSEHMVAVTLGVDGKEIGRRFLAVPTLPEEQFRPIRVGSDGSVYQFVIAENGATIERFGP